MIRTRDMAANTMRRVVALALFMAAFDPARAGPGPPADAAMPTTVEGVDVIAPGRPKTPPPRAAVEAYVGAIGALSDSGQLATWSPVALPTGSSPPLGDLAQPAVGQTICTLVMGLPVEHADFITDRIRVVGKALGAPVSDKPCRKADNNVVIVFPDDAPAFIRALAEEKPQAFGFPSHGALVQDLAQPAQPIRAWYGLRTVVTERRASRLAPPTQSVIVQVLVVVDRDKTDALNMGQLSDYLAMIVLAKVRPEKTPADAASILNVFHDVAAGRAAASGMTRMDAAYLQALYAVGPRQPGERQNAQIAERVRNSLVRR